ncbi:MAG: NAD(+) diphosphatase [Nocardioides sp.]|uniref:NAD(+) diphosphatase n=1 Tax=Nocardioides sp. TaxID=35761 RepID=UPI0039E4CFFC
MSQQSASRQPVHQRLASAPHHRASLHRTDQEWLDARWAEPATRVLVVAGNRVEPAHDRPGVVWRSADRAPAGTRVFLGERDGAAAFAVLTGRERAGEGWVDLRGLFPALLHDNADASLLFHAIGIAEWHRATRFCPRCGEPLAARAGGHELVCGNGHPSFPRSDPAVIMLITDGEPGSERERCLLGHDARWPGPRFSTLAGFCEPGETLEDAVRREVAEETSVVVGEVSYFGNQPWPLPASLMLGFTGRAVDAHIAVDEVEVVEARWFTRAELHDQAAAGEVMLPSGVSISRALIESWYGGELPGSW